MKSKHIIIIIICIFNLEVYCQNFKCITSSSKIDTVPNGMFVKYKAPECPEYFFCTFTDSLKLYNSDIHIAVRVEVNKDSTAYILDFSPLFGLSKEFPPNDPIWVHCESSIRDAIKEWVFMPIWLHEEKSKDGSLILVPNNCASIYLFMFSFYQFNSNKAYISTIDIDIE